MLCTIAGKPVNPVGYGMISLMHPGRISTENAIDILKAALTSGSNLWNASDYYGTPEWNSLHLLNAYFTKYPEDADKVVICVKSCIDVRNSMTFNDAAGVQTCIERVLKILGGKCRLDVFQPGRLSRDVPVEETVGAIAEYVKAGKIGAVGLSECSGASIRRTTAVTTISMVEVELSLFEKGIFGNGVTDACKELRIPIIAYSPIGRGFLTGDLRRYEDMHENDYRKVFPRFSRENFANNMQLVEVAEDIARKKECTTAQVALAWVLAQSEIIGTPVVPIPGTAQVKRLKENNNIVKLTESELREIEEALNRVEVKGARYPEHHTHLLNI